MSDPILSIKGVSVDFDASRVADDSVEADRTLAVVGESG